MSRSTDHTGRVIGASTVVRRLERNGLWLVRCGCNALIEVTSDRIRNAVSHHFGARKTPAHVRCRSCTNRSRAAAAKKHGALFATQRRAG